MTSIPDHYAALGIDPTADQEVITAAYRALAKKFHPDTGATTGTASPERFDQVQRAYEVLRTPESRHRYDLELLAATERELEEHLASKQRVVPWAGNGNANPPPDLGDIRPERVTRPARRPPPRGLKPRNVLPFLVPLLLLVAIAGGGLWMFLPKGPEAPPLPGAAAPEKIATATKQEPPAPPASASAPAPATPAADAAPQEPPLFGSTATDSSPAPAVQQASAPPAMTPVPAPDAAKPVFGTSLDDQPAAAPAAPADDAAPGAPPPLPKLRPSQTAAKPVQQPAQPPVRQAAQPQPQPQPQQQDLQQQPARIAGEGAYRLVIFERQPGQVPTAWSAGVIFDSEGSCTRFGVKTVLRRKANRDPYMGDSKIWYECQLASAQ